MVAQDIRLGTWRTPAVILVCGCLIAILGFGARSGLGFFLTPMSSAYGWDRAVFSLPLAIPMLLSGAAQPCRGGRAGRCRPARPVRRRAPRSSLSRARRR